MRGAARLDAMLAAVFTVAATAEAAMRFQTMPDRLALVVGAALMLAPLAVRRTRPILALCSIGAGAVAVALVTHVVWPGEPVEATVVVVAMMVATYSVGAHGDGLVAPLLAVVVPIVTVLASDLTVSSGSSLSSGVIFAGLFMGVVPLLVGRMVRVRAWRVDRLRDRRDAIVREQTAQREAAVVTERLAVAERLRPALVNGMSRLADAAANNAPAAEIEGAARLLLASTRREVVALTAEVDPGPAPGTALPPTPRDRAGAPTWLVLTTLVSTWVVIAVLIRSLGPLGDGLVEAAVALGTSLAAGLLLRWPIAGVGLLTCIAGHALSTGPNDLPGTIAAMVIAWAAGLVLRDLGSLAQQLRDANDVMAGEEGSLVRRAVLEERMRIARDVHDVLGHTLTVVALQAAAARRIAATDAARAEEVVRGLTKVARDGVRALDEQAPPSGFASLLDRTRAAGIAVSAQVADEVHLSDEARAIAYRLVQESLTNVLRYAPGATASVVVRCCDEHIVVEVTNTAPTRSPEPRGSGRGLAGLRERVAAYAGEVSWGPTAEGGFAVLARLPMQVGLT